MPKIKSTWVLHALVAAVALTVVPVLIGHKALAQMAMGTSTSLQILSPEAKPGHIVTRINGGFDLAKEPYDVELFGVIVESSTLSLFDTTEPQARLVMQTGTAQILVSSANGTIAKGDYITSSSNPGVGQKADKTGFVIGKALEDFSPASPNDAGPVWATLEPKTAYINNTVQTNLLEAIKSGALSPLLNPVESLRYILAALIVASTFIIGFSTFGKSSGRSIEAMGRNPLAQQSIRTAMIFNMILSFGVMLIGLALAYLILVL